ncbi:MAG: NAD-dependent epimerase/dehydratase family protein [Alphaproteobacteria bacterium]
MTQTDRRPPGASLVTGGAGFVGRHLVEALACEGGSVRSLDIAGDRLAVEGVESVTGSITDRDAVARAMAGMDTVFHAGANAQLWLRNKSAFETVNFEGTRIVLEAARAAGVRRFIHVSSLTVLVGRHMGRAPISLDETNRNLTADEMLGPYPRSKLLGEQAALAANAPDFSVTAVLPTLPIGPGDDHLTAPTRMIVDLVNGQIPAYLDCVHNLVDVRDLAQGMIAARDKGRPGERYLLGGQNISMADLLDVLRDMTGRTMPSARAPYPLALMAGAMAEFLADMVTRRPPRAPLTGVRLAGRRIHFDSAKARTDLGFTVRPMRESLREALIWARDHGHIIRPMPKLTRAD